MDDDDVKKKMLDDFKIREKKYIGIPLSNVFVILFLMIPTVYFKNYIWCGFKNHVRWIIKIKGVKFTIKHSSKFISENIMFMKILVCFFISITLVFFYKKIKNKSFY